MIKLSKDEKLNRSIMEKPKRVFDTIQIFLKSGRALKFEGCYCPEYETDRWHYYMRKNGYLLHFAKDSIEYVDGGTEEKLLESRKIKLQSGFSAIKGVPVTENTKECLPEATRTPQKVYMFRQWLQKLEENCSNLNYMKEYEKTSAHLSNQEILQKLTEINNDIITSKTQESPRGKLLGNIVALLYHLWFVSFDELQNMYIWYPTYCKYAETKHNVIKLIEEYEKNYENFSS